MAIASAYLETFPKEHRTKLHSTNPLERVNGEVKRRVEVVGIFPNEAAVVRLVGAILLEHPLHDPGIHRPARR
jgi:transposase-like protein